MGGRVSWDWCPCENRRASESWPSLCAHTEEGPCEDTARRCHPQARKSSQQEPSRWHLDVRLPPPDCEHERSVAEAARSVIFRDGCLSQQGHQRCETVNITMGAMPGREKSPRVSAYKAPGAQQPESTQASWSTTPHSESRQCHCFKETWWTHGACPMKANRSQSRGLAVFRAVTWGNSLAKSESSLQTG